MRAIAAAAALLASQACLAAATPAATPATAPGSLGGQLAQMVFGLLLVVGLIFFLAWLLRRLQSTAVKGGQVIEIVGSRAIGPRDRLLLVQVGKEQILIGHTLAASRPCMCWPSPWKCRKTPARRRRSLPSG